ncbi:unnamed protein product [Nesidiocoris tenuis]|uniref:Spondin-like TSP1 domain-containing protein n=1 Tax=Nesidiocoris tenuis TaxID=355587 RepID=A0A6H5GG11_9HEMI|nr:unnamed protein product [Nesidiocoris tenuis]
MSGRCQALHSGRFNAFASPSWFILRLFRPRRSFLLRKIIDSLRISGRPGIYSEIVGHPFLFVGLDSVIVDFWVVSRKSVIGTQTQTGTAQTETFRAENQTVTKTQTDTETGTQTHPETKIQTATVRPGAMEALTPRAFLLLLTFIGPTIGRTVIEKKYLWMSGSFSLTKKHNVTFFYGIRGYAYSLTLQMNGATATYLKVAGMDNVSGPFGARRKRRRKPLLNIIANPRTNQHGLSPALSPAAIIKLSEWRSCDEEDPTCESPSSASSTRLRVEKWGECRPSFPPLPGTSAQGGIGNEDESPPQNAPLWDGDVMGHADNYYKHWPQVGTQHRTVTCLDPTGVQLDIRNGQIYQNGGEKYFVFMKVKGKAAPTLLKPKRPNPTSHSALIKGHPCPDPDEFMQIEGCNIHGCHGYSWMTLPWQECNATCDREGFQVREVWCSENQEQVPDDKCLSLEKPAEFRRCTKDCPTECQVSPWSEWSKCNAHTCYPNGTRGGTTIQTRYRVVLEEGKDCGPLVEHAPCPAGPYRPCPTYHWTTGNWSHCQLAKGVLCGHGLRTRGLSAQHAACQALPLVETMPCPCAQYDPLPLSEWSSCLSNESTTCGTGTRYRAMACVDTKQQTVDPSLCGGSSGLQEEPCLLPCPADCMLGEWTAWNECSAVCGPGIQNRTRMILRDAAGNGRPCAATTETKICNTSCDVFQWQASGWSECSLLPSDRPLGCGTGDQYRQGAACGHGVRTRNVSCIKMNDNSTVELWHCAGSASRKTISTNE